MLGLSCDVATLKWSLVYGDSNVPKLDPVCQQNKFWGLFCDFEGRLLKTKGALMSLL